jgi:hypothetical protein
VIRPPSSGLSRRRPSPALVVAVVALAAAVAGTAIAGPDLMTRAVSTAKVKKIAKQQASKQIKKKAVLGPGTIVTAIKRPDLTDPQDFVVLRVPGVIRLTIYCYGTGTNFDYWNDTDELMRFSGALIADNNDPRFNEGAAGPGQSFGLVGGNSGGFDTTMHAIAGRTAVQVDAVFHEVTGTECPVSAQAVVTR